MDIIVQARLSSHRLPGKILRDFGGKCLLDFLFDRLRLSQRAGRIILATSSDASDDPVEIFARQREIKIFRGSLNNVADRFAGVIQRYNVKAFARISGDSPLLDPALLDTLVSLFESEAADIVTNVHPKTFPKGQSIEVIQSEMYLKALRNFATPDEFEHVTPYFYQHAEQFVIKNHQRERDLNDIRLCIDTQADALVFESMLKAMTKPHQSYSLDELIDLYGSVQERRAS